MQKLAKKHKMVMVIPVYEKEMSGVFYNTAAVIDADGRYLGKYRKTHIPHWHLDSGRNFIFDLGILVTPFSTWASPKSAFTFVTTGTFQRAHALWGLMARK